VLQRVAIEQSDDLVGARQPAMRTLVGRQFRHVGAEQPYLSGRRRQVAGDLVEQGCLAGAVRPDDQAAFTRADRERDVLGGNQPAE
jgi:hypothetical protein